MGITINIYYHGTSENIQNFVNEMIDQKIVEKIRAQAGNLKYEYYFAIEDKTELLLIDQWQSQEALDTHHKSTMMNEIIKLRDKYNLTMNVNKFITNDNGITDEDKKYVK